MHRSVARFFYSAVKLVAEAMFKEEGVQSFKLGWRRLQHWI
jgi:hypothetical protein